MSDSYCKCPAPRGIDLEPGSTWDGRCGLCGLVVDFSQREARADEGRSAEQPGPGAPTAVPGAVRSAGPLARELVGYSIHRRSDRVCCDVIWTQPPLATALPHLVHHSPDGFEIGYGGSGPADLARSIIGHLMGTTSPDPRIYQDFKFAFLATDEFRFGRNIPVELIRAWMREHFAQTFCERCGLPHAGDTSCEAELEAQRDEDDRAGSLS